MSKREVVTTFAGESVLTLPTVSRKQIKQAVERFQWEALRGRVERQLRGEVDLLSLYFDSFGKDGYKPLQAIEIKGDDRVCIPAHPPSDIRFRLGLAAENILHFAVAIDPQVWELRPEGTRFVIEIKQGKAERPIFEKVIDPKNQIKDRRWVDATVALDIVGNTELRFRTETVGTNTEYGWALWAHPYIERAG